MNWLKRLRKVPGDDLVASGVERIDPGLMEPGDRPSIQAIASPKKAKAGVPAPFLDARRTYATLTGSDVAQKHIWQMLAVIGLLTGIAGIAGNVYHASQSTMVPYVIQVDKLGQTAAVGRAAWTGNADPVVVQSFLAAWVGSARMVTPDALLQRQAVFNVYALLAPNDTATGKLTSYFASEDADPFKRAGKELVEVQIETALPLTKDSWQVDWTEKIYERTGVKRTASTRMRATLQVYIAPPTRRTTEEQMRRNPLGIYIKDFTWAKQIDPLPELKR